MTSDLVVHVVAAKADLASSSRAVELTYARECIQDWITTPESAASTLMSSRSNTSSNATRALAKLSAQANAAMEERQASASSGLGSKWFQATPKSSTIKSNDEALKARIPAWCEVEVSEVSAKDDVGTAQTFSLQAEVLIQLFRQALKTCLYMSRVDSSNAKCKSKGRGSFDLEIPSCSPK